MRSAKECDARRLVSICAALVLALSAAAAGTWAAQPAIEAERGAPGFNRVEPQLPRVVPASRTESIPDAQSRYNYILHPVGPEVIWDQIDQQCGGEVFRESFASVMGWLRNVEPPGGAGADYWNADGVQPMPAFICTGAQNLYLLDQVEADGSWMNGVDLKYWTTTTGACADNYIRVHFRSRTVLPAVGNYIVVYPGEYVMGPMPVNVHPPPDPAGYTAYFIRMSTPYCVPECKAGYLVAELEDEGLPVDLSYSNLVEGTQVETERVWLPTTSVRSRSFGVAMSLNEGWDGDPETDEQTMGWYLASRDYADVDPVFDMFAFLDKDRD
ncbi:MAG: hypothetical protein JSU68_04845, partial [Phycisphaerales bacterium]